MEPEKKKKKPFLALGIVALVLAVLGAGAFILWNSPLLGRALPSSLHSLLRTVPLAGLEEAAPETAAEETQASADLAAGTQPASESALPSLAPITADALAQDPRSPAPKTACGGPESLTMLILGIDNMEQADAIYLTRLDFATEKVTAVSIPRDFWIKVTDMQDRDISYGRINATYGYGQFFNGPGGGIVSLATNIQANFGVGINQYFILHFDSIAEYIDLIGGVDLNLAKRETDGYSSFPAGPNHLDGEDAVIFMRMRMSDSDYQRVQRQSLVLKAFFDKVTQQLNLWDWVKLGVKVVSDRSIRTDLAIKDVASFVCLARALDKEDLRFVQIPHTMFHGWTTEEGAAVLIPHNDVPEFLQSVMDGSYTGE